MNGLSGARVVLLDDESSEALPIVKAFSRVGVPTVFFDGKEGDLPKSKKKLLRGVRLAILDMNLGINGPDKTIASTLVQTFSKIISPENGPYGILIWTNHPDLKDLVAQYIYEHPTLPNPVFVAMLKKAAFKKRTRRGGPQQFSIGKLSKELLKILADSSPLECMQVWEGACFRAATNVTNSIADLSDSTATDLDQWRRAWREEALKLLLVISKARAEEHHTRENTIPSIFLTLNPLHSDRMDVLAEELAADVSSHVDQIMAATGGSAVERKAKVNSMLHLASDQLDNFSPGNLFVFGKTKPSFMPSMKDALQGCIEGSQTRQAENLKVVMQCARLCGLEATPVCDYAQNKMGLSRIVVGFVVPSEHQGKIKSGQFLKAAGPFYLAEKPLVAGAYMLFFNSRYVATAKPTVVKQLRAVARVRPQLLADIQGWASYQAARQGVMLLK
jgi:hypothetical protein